MVALEKILEKLELKREVIIDLDITKENFISGLEKQMKSELESPLFSGLELFSSDNQPFIGGFNQGGFTLRSKRIAGKRLRHVPVAKGIIDENENGLSVSIEINAFRGIYSFFLMLLPIFYILVFLFCLYIAIFKLDSSAFVSLIFILLHGAFMIGIPIYWLSKAARILDQNLIHEIEKIANYYSTN